MQKILLGLMMMAILSIPGVIPAAERGNDPGQRLEKHFADMDADGDGGITHDEFIQKRVENFHNVDVNGDGEVTLDELTAARAQRLQTRLAERFSTLDEDNSNTLSEDEMVSGAAAQFERLDANGDGAVTIEEFRDAISSR